MYPALVPLEVYRAKRKFGQTPEPKGGVARGDAPIFVVQKHSARRLHYDFRLQIGDTLKSWAVPEGPCLDPKVKRFAKLVEDHPMDYASFEGSIPDGNYGAGTVIVWDRGTWVTLADDPNEALKNGELKFRLAGTKLAGGWTLVQLKDDPTNFLLIKERDIEARPIAEYDVLKEEPNSAITGRPVEDPSDAVWTSSRPAKSSAKTRSAAKKEAEPTAAKKIAPPKAEKLEGAREKEFPKTWSPQLAGSLEAPPTGENWLHEIKYDGYRTLAFFDRGKVKLLTRNGHDWTKRYSALAKAFEKLPCKTAIVDGEVVVQDPRGITSLNLLEEALSKGESHDMTYFAFDLCYLDGYDLSAVPLIERKHALEGLIAPLVNQRSAIQLSQHFEGSGADLFMRASQMGLEGIVSKRRDARYVQKRSDTWMKVKRVDLGKFIVIGYAASSPKTVTSVLLAEEREDGLAYACRAGSGISEKLGRELYTEFSKAERKTPIVEVPRTETRDAKFVEPDWIVNLAYRNRSAGNAPRAPTVVTVSKVQPKKVALKPKLVSDRDLASIHLTNPERKMLGTDVTKLDIALYYARIGDWLLPELLRRPVTIIRCPSGDAKDIFYQRHAFAGLPEGVETIHLKDEEGRAAFITVTQPKGYLALAQFGAVEFHLWGCRVDDPEHPDRLVFDLDPDPDLPWGRVCDGAEMLRERLEAMGFHIFLRTTGGKGLHLVVALEPKHDWPTVKGFANAVAQAMAKDHPNLFVAIASKERRKSRIYIDYLRNGRGASAVSSYSLRARPNFPVSVPIGWEELRSLAGGDAFNRVNIWRRMETLAADPWDELESSAAQISPRMRRDVGMK
jgi:bifunctional non-homologous end joining protein LigD